MKIGIPRALFYWKNPYLWEEFFKSLGEEVILSPETNKEIVIQGTKISDPETCFSMKVFFGHVFWLEGKVDYIFVPLMKSNKDKLEYCPKFFGIPDLAKILVKTPILTETFDQRKRPIEETLEKIAETLNKDQKTTRKAIAAAFAREKEKKAKEEHDFYKTVKSEKKKIVLVSHPYNLYDDYINVGIRKKLGDLGIETICIDEIPLNLGLKFSPEVKFHWEFGREIMQKTEEVLRYDIAGAIEISSFQCGCDAVLKEFVEKRFKQSKIPFLYLIIDEQSGDAGVQTRLEAFVDTLK
ncbi:hypothetical protein KAR26_00330 [Candidatus Parcubacteria bacterium]|nr:hypothetical protein [Candidatus Parcubacteria bacterium]